MGQFLKPLIASFIGTIAAVFLLISLGAASLAFFLISFSQKDSIPGISAPSILVFDLSTEIRDKPSPLTLNGLIREENLPVMSLSQVLKGIDQAADDKQIVGLLLKGTSTIRPGSGYAVLSEVRRALEKFRASGKTIIAYDINWSEREYYLASVANKVAINPLGTLEFNGFNREFVLFSEALKKFGIGVQVTRAGNYKGAVEPFIRNNLSPENRQQIQLLMSDLWKNYLQTVADSRPPSVERLEATANQQGFLDPEMAKQFQLVDQVAYFDQVVDNLKQLTDETQNHDRQFRSIKLNSYVGHNAVEGESTKRNEVAVVYAQGSIVNGLGTISQVGSDRFAKILRKLQDKEAVKAVVLRIDSPGGSATASEVILREVQKLSKRKPVVVSMGNVAASGGYWIATGSEKIIAEATTVTGSIGVFGTFINFEEIGQRNGITWEGIKTAEFADINSSSRPKTSEELALFQDRVDQTYQSFLERVAKARKLPEAKVAEIAQGRVWSGKAAQQIGLVDQVGGLESAVFAAAESADLGKNWTLVEYPKPQNLETALIQRFIESHLEIFAPSIDPWSQQLINLQKELRLFTQFNDPQGIYTYLPFNWQMK